MVFQYDMVGMGSGSDESTAAAPRTAENGSKAGVMGSGQRRG
jgi:hypothetical protein